MGMLRIHPKLAGDVNFTGKSGSRLGKYEGLAGATRELITQLMLHTSRSALLFLLFSLSLFG